MTREERIRRVEELEKELNLLEKEEIVKHNIYYDKKMQLHREKEKERIEKLQVEIKNYSQELVGILKRKIEIRQELKELNNKHRYLQYAEN